MDEFELIGALSKGVPRAAEGLLQGVDDDAAVFEGPRNTAWLVATDILAENVHFKRGWMTLEEIGRKALLVNISDIVAMGAVPWFYLVSFGCPPDLSAPDVKRIFDGMKAAADNYSVTLIGGDTTGSDSGIFLSITVIGNSEREEVVYRGGAKPGDGIYVSGALGGAAAGLDVLRNALDTEAHRDVVARFREPVPCLKLGRWLSRRRAANSMIDVSDGLISDMNHIADLSGVGYEINADLVPACSGVADVAEEMGRSILDYTLAGGEDYELLFTMNERDVNGFFDACVEGSFKSSITKIGEVLEAGRREVVDEKGRQVKLSSAGFRHKIGS